MHVRDAVEADAGALAALAGSPTDVMRNLVHDRTVRVADGEDDLVGFVSFDAGRQTVHVTQIAGTDAAVERLLGEPRRFAVNEEMGVELLIEAADERLRTIAEAVGFEDEGIGPRFGGTPTVRYRLDPT